MNSITDLINDKADELFPTESTAPTAEDDNAIDLEDYSDSDIGNDTKPEVKPEPIANDTFEGLEIREENNIMSSAPTDTSIDIGSLKSKIYSIRDQLDAVIRLIENDNVKLTTDSIMNAPEAPQEATNSNERIVEGIFDGEKMIDAHNKEYSIPPNYASKSKLVEGDVLKLTITNSGRFIYKQISPIDRERKIGVLAKSTEIDQWCVLDNGKKYKILNASVTFYKGKPGDEVIYIIAKDKPNTWAAVDNIVRKFE
ncbi:MAG: hypothetical protein Q8P20_03000 [bacterium]|nr:hypothetical protein [bacterium]